MPVLDTPFSIPASPQAPPNGLSAAPSSLYIGHEFDCESMVEDETPEACSLASVASQAQGTMTSFENISTSSLLAYTHLHRAPVKSSLTHSFTPIMYDVMLAPSARSVVDRLTRSAVPTSILDQPATDPPIPAGGWFVLQSHKLPWAIVVTASSRHCFPSPQSPASADAILLGRRLAIVGLSIHPPSLHTSTSGGSTITILDVLYAAHATLMVPITPEEWEALGHGSKAQRKVTRAYERRCTRMGGGWEGGVLRMDWLGQKTILAGVDVDKAAAPGEGKLVFAKP
ncbi:hypothetical protein TRAPUB_12072 [Trametes pubescens]|uniref:DUF6699 domain-containing protein n=1 Tax=Trametes pubescens TaxID=154538 RepID=A0A1M2VUX3_TRAPU|nr:hypothetical protein TRAPUB_12072 [Trametes pubescens]